MKGKIKVKIWTGLLISGLVFSLAQCKGKQLAESNVSSAKEEVSKGEVRTPLHVIIIDDMEGKEVLANYTFVDLSTVKRIALAQNIVACTIVSSQKEVEANINVLLENKRISKVKVVPGK